jgi:regulator of replication initiation timing
MKKKTVTELEHENTLLRLELAILRDQSEDTLKAERLTRENADLQRTIERERRALVRSYATILV